MDVSFPVFIQVSFDEEGGISKIDSPEEMIPYFEDSELSDFVAWDADGIPLKLYRPEDQSEHVGLEPISSLDQLNEHIRRCALVSNPAADEEDDPVKMWKMLNPDKPEKRIELFTVGLVLGVLAILVFAIIGLISVVRWLI